jgi:hypothetical protein
MTMEAPPACWRRLLWQNRQPECVEVPMGPWQAILWSTARNAAHPQGGVQHLFLSSPPKRIAQYLHSSVAT